MIVEPMVNDVKVLKEKEYSVGKEFEYMLKQATTRMHDEVNKVSEDLRRIKVLNDVDAVRT